MQFEFATAASIVFGRGKAGDLSRLTREFGTRALVVTGRDAGRAAAAIDSLRDAGFSVSTFAMPSEPTVELVRDAVPQGREADCVIGFGGGSAIDGAKAIAAVAANSGEPLDYLEVVGRGQQLENTPKPFIAVPTTAGTGAEVTRNAVLWSPEHGVKASLRDSSMLARVALIDPDLTLAVPPEITANTGLDTLTQLIEAYTSCRANELVDLFCIEGIQRVTASLRKAFQHPSDGDARESMSFASLLSGLALANAGLGVVHGFAAPLGAMLSAPHGAICAALLPAGMSANIHALQRREPDSHYLQRYHRVAELLTGRPQARAEEGVVWIRQLCSDLGVKRLADLGLTRHDIPQAADKAARSSSMKGNPLRLSHEELIEVAEEAF